MRCCLMVIALLCGTAATAASIKPGRWEITSTVTSIDMPGDPGGIAKSMVGRVTVHKACITAQQAASGPEALFKATGGKCRYDRLVMAGGRIDGAMSCGPGGMRSAMTGTMTPMAYAITSRTKTPMMTMASTTKGRWTGPC